jgi:ferredoxin
MDKQKLCAWLEILEKIIANIIPEFAVQIADFVYKIIQINIESLETDDDKKIFTPKFITLIKTIQPILEGLCSPQNNSNLCRKAWDEITQKILESCDAKTQNCCQEFVYFMKSQMQTDEEYEKAPVLFLPFCKIETAIIVFNAIKKFKPKKLYVFSDGWREQKGGEREKVEYLRKFVVENVDWDCELHTKFCEKNLGTRFGIETAIDWFFENEEMGIILEDDCLPSQSFFRFCSELLEKYKNEENVFLISGSNRESDSKNLSANSYYFWEFTSIWGWATWRRASNKKRKKISKIENYKEKYNDDFVANSVIQNYCKSLYMKFLVVQMEWIVYKNFDTWDYQWFFSVMQNDGLCIFPDCNMVTNIGCGIDDATHTLSKLNSSGNIPQGNFYFPIKHPEKIAAKHMTVEQFIAFCYRHLEFDGSNIEGFKKTEKLSISVILNQLQILDTVKSASTDEKNLIKRCYENTFLKDMVFYALNRKIYPNAQKYLYEALCRTAFPNKDYNCLNCRTCIMVCPTKSVILTQNGEEYAIGINRESCNSCFNCVKFCPIVNPK